MEVVWWRWWSDGGCGLVVTVMMVVGVGVLVTVVQWRWYLMN